METNLTGAGQRGPGFPWARILRFCASALLVAVGSPARASSLPETTLAAEVMRFVEDSPEYLELHSLYERRTRAAGEAWTQSVQGERMRTTLQRLLDEAASATSLDPGDPAGRHNVNFTSAAGRVTRLTSIPPSRVEQEPAYRRNIGGLVCRFILEQAYNDGVLLLPALPASAQTELAHGIAAAQAADYPGAIAHFQAARATPYFADDLSLSRRAPEIYFNLALAESRLPGRELRAIAWFNAYLVSDPYTTAPDAPAVQAEIMRLWRKNEANLGKVLRTLESSARAIFQGLGREQGEELQSGDDIRVRDRKGRNLTAVARLWAEAGDIPAALRTADLPQREEYRRYGLSDVAEAQAGFDDLAGAWKTAERRPEPNFLASIRHAIVCAQVRNGDLAAARETLTLMPAGVSREWAEYAIQTGHPIVPGRYDLHLPFDREMLKQTTVERPWIALLEDTEAGNDSPLNTAPFLALGATLAGAPGGEDPQAIFDALLDIANRLSLARHIIDRLLHAPAATIPVRFTHPSMDETRAQLVADATAGAEAIRQSFRPWRDRVGMVLPEASAFVAGLAERGLPLEPIPAGQFLEGGMEEDPNAAEPLPTITLTQPYFLGATEITRAQWAQVMSLPPGDAAEASLPVDEVSWEEAMAFCQKLNERERIAKRLPEGWAFSLPTEAQWEHACRAGKNGPIPGPLDARAWYEANRADRQIPQTVATKQSNAWGLYDMQGNAWEMCLDWEGDDTTESVAIDPTGPPTGTMRVLRGGSIFDDAEGCDPNARALAAPDARGNWGFRVALVRL